MGALSSSFATHSENYTTEELDLIELPLEFVDPRLQDGWAALNPFVRFARLQEHVTRVRHKLRTQVRIGVAYAKDFFEQMLEANYNDKHDPAAFTNKIMEDTLCHYLESMFKEGGCKVIDVVDLLTDTDGGFSFSYQDTAPRDIIFDNLCPRLGYVEKPVQEYGSENWDYVGVLESQQGEEHITRVSHSRH